MAITLNFNLVCSTLIDIQSILQNFKIGNFEISIEQICCIEDWTWTNPQRIQDISTIDEKLNQNNIIIINFISNTLKDLGLYIEKIDGDYVYDLWVNTEGYPVLDADTINNNNKAYYNLFYVTLENILKQQNIKYKMIAIGLETKFEYKYNILDTIKYSDNVIVWIINKFFDVNIDLAGYQRKAVEFLDGSVYEK